MEDLLTRKKSKLEKPKDYNVIFVNDDFTPFNVVMHILVEVFGMTVEQSGQFALKVHNEGKGIAGTYPYEIAETKAKQGETIAHGFECPLKLDVQPNG